MRTEEETLKYIKEVDTWWNRLIGFYYTYYSLEDGNPRPDLLIIDEGSHKYLLKEIEKNSAQELFASIEIIKIPRLGRSEVFFYKRLKQ